MLAKVHQFHGSGSRARFVISTEDALDIAARLVAVFRSGTEKAVNDVNIQKQTRLFNHRMPVISKNELMPQTIRGVEESVSSKEFPIICNIFGFDCDLSIMNSNANYTALSKLRLCKEQVL